MSAGAEATATAPAPRKNPFAPLGALLVRDLSGRRRGATLTWARSLAIAVSSLAAIVTYAMATTDSFAPHGVSVLLFLGLGLITATIAPALAISALRRERESGTLDILLLAGLPPRAVTLGRTLSIFVFFESLLLSSLPALALFWFFRRPSPEELLLCSLDYTAWCFALAGVVVLVSAWSRSSGLAVVATGGLVFAWIVVLVTLARHGGARLFSPLALLVDTLTAEASDVPPVSLHLESAAIHVLAGTALALLASAGLSRTEGVRRDVLLERLEPRAGRRPPGRLPLTWLVQRQSAATRPIVQAGVLLVVFVVVFVPMALLTLALRGESGRLAELLPPELLAATAFALLGCSLAIAVAAGATEVVSCREKRTWDSLLSTALPGRRMLLDLVLAALLAAAVPGAAGLGLLAALPTSDGGLVLVLAQVLAFGATLLLAAIIGVLVSCSAESTAGALVIAFATLLGVPAWCAFSSFSFSEELFRESMRAPSVLVAPAATVAVLLASLVLLAKGRGRPGPAATTFGALLALSSAVPVLLTLGSDIEVKEAEALGGGTVVIAMLQRAMAWDPHLAASDVLGGAALHVLFALTLAALAARRSDAWLGRAA